MENTFKSMTDFASEIERIYKASQDYIVPSRKLSLRNDSFMVIDNDKEFAMNSYADSQLASKLGIPKNYWEKCLEVKGLRDLNANAWFAAEADKNRMIRTVDNTVRAVVSDRFARIDNFPILDALFPVLQQANRDYGIEIVSNGLSETKMYLHVLFPRQSREINVGDIVQHGILFTNSEVGAGRYDISHWTRRLRCRNGMTGDSIIKKNHVGRKLESDDDGEGLFKSDTLASELRTIALKSRDALEEAIHGDWFENEFLRMKESAQDVIVKPIETVEKAVKLLSLPDYSKDLVLTNLIKDGELTRWGLANAITALAHSDEFKEPDKASLVEQLGTNVVRMTKKDWNSLTQ
jgi:uncharacterized protein YunC (DUF1805 family)